MLIKTKVRVGADNSAYYTQFGSVDTKSYFLHGFLLLLKTEPGKAVDIVTGIMYSFEKEVMVTIVREIRITYKIV